MRSFLRSFGKTAYVKAWAHRAAPESEAMSVPRSAETFGSLLRHHRAAAGLTQMGLAERSGISLRTVQQLEGDIARPRRATVGHLIQALSISGSARAELETLAATAPGAPAAHRVR